MDDLAALGRARKTGAAAANAGGRVHWGCHAHLFWLSSLHATKMPFTCGSGTEPAGLYGTDLLLGLSTNACVRYFLVG